MQSIALAKTQPALAFSETSGLGLSWAGPEDSLAFDDAGVQSCLLDLDRPVYCVLHNGRPGITNEGSIALSGASGDGNLLAYLPPLPLQQLGDPLFKQAYGLKYAYAAGAMANGIASESLCIELGQSG
jgi:trans-AT polyketide synthase/acyltransferase/oxidoreductase domain-containing protein